MARTMDDLRAPSTSWAEEVRKYEQEKRRCIDEGLVRGTRVPVTGSQKQQQERVFDPLLQRYRDPATESAHRLTQEKERIVHLNRAQDTQNLREQPFHIINHTSRVEALAPGMDPSRLGAKQRTLHGKGSYPDSATDYNILSNLPVDVHHWDKPGCKPMVQDREPKPRVVPSHLVKDFDLITNRYLDGHEERTERDKELNLREAAYKYTKCNRFDPITQQFNDPSVESRAQVCDDAREIEAHLRHQAGIPPAVRGRLSAHYDPVTHEEKDKETLKIWDQLEGRRRERYTNRHIMTQNLHAQDYRAEQITHSRWIGRMAPERYTESTDRGYDIVTNQGFGPAPHQKTVHQSLARPRQTPWQKATGRTLSMATLPPGFNEGLAEATSQAPAAMHRTMSSASMTSSSRDHKEWGGASSREPVRVMTGSSSAPQLRQQSEKLSPAGATAAPFALRGSSGGSGVPRSQRSDHSGSLQYTRGFGGPPPAASMGSAGYATTPHFVSFGATGPPPAPQFPGSSMGSAYSRPIAAAA